MVGTWGGGNGMMLSSKLRVSITTSPLLLNKTFLIFSSSNSSSFQFQCHFQFQFQFQFYHATAATQPNTNYNNNSDYYHYSKDVVSSSFKQWFKSRDNTLFDRIFLILSSTNNQNQYYHREDHVASSSSGSGIGQSAEMALSQLGLRLTEDFVLKTLNHNGGKDVLSSLKFFDWTGRQSGFSHTRSTFNAIFKILSKAKLMSLMLDFLETYKTHKHNHRVRFYSILVMGYAVAGKPHIALQLFGKMRFNGQDLDPFSYHVLLNALVEHSCFDVVDVVYNQITLRSFHNHVTSSIKVKALCKQNKLDEAQSFLRALYTGCGTSVNDHALGVLVDALCKTNKFEEAGQMVDEFCHLGNTPLPHAYAVWIRDLVQAGKVDGVMDFLQSKKILQGYVPDVFRYNILICRLLRENRLHDVCHLLMEMREENISPDKVTMNAALCLFCKAGMVDVALELYSSRKEFGMSLNSLAYNYLINTLCGNGSVDEAYWVLRDSIDQGYFPGKKTFSILADALCRERKLDKMEELIIIALEQNVMPSDDVYFKFISALCKAKRVEDGYLIHEQLNRMNKVTSKHSYFNLIRGFNWSSRGDMASRLLIEMQENGHTPTRQLCRAVIRCLCTMDNPEDHFFKLLEMQLSSHREPNCQIYNFFIDGAAHAKKPDLARKVFEMMVRSGVGPSSVSKVLMLQAYLKNARIADALNFYGDMCEKTNPPRKLYSTMISGLSKANKPGLAFDVLRKAREKGLVPRLQCYEELVRSSCSTKDYDMVVDVIDDLVKAGRPVSSFIGNILLLHSSNDPELYVAWVRSRVVTREAPSCILTLGGLVGLFSGGIRLDKQLKDLDETIEQCFPLDIFTYNVLLRRVSMVQGIDSVLELFCKMCKKGYQPNQWTFDIIIHGLCKHGRRNEAMRWVNEMHRKGLDPTERVRQLIQSI